MLAILIALALLCLSVLGVYLLLKSMGEDGVEAAAPGSCRSGRCGVRSDPATEAPVVHEQYLRVDQIGHSRAPASPGDHPQQTRPDSQRPA